MNKNKPYIALIISLLLLFSVKVFAVLAPEKFDATHCIVPLIGPQNVYMKQRGIADFFRVYPIPPYLLVNDDSGSLWTIKDFNQTSIYFPKINLTYFDASIFSSEKNTVYIYDPLTWKFPKAHHGAFYKFQGFNYPELVEHDEVYKLLNQGGKQNDMRLSSSTVIPLKNETYIAVRKTGVYLVDATGKATPILGNQLFRPLGVELYSMVGRNDILANTYTGLFVIGENSAFVSAHCTQVVPSNTHNYKLTPLLTNINDDVVYGAFKVGEEKYLINTQEMSFWLFDHGSNKKLEMPSDVMNAISSEPINIQEKYDSHTILSGPFIFQLKNTHYRLAKYDITPRKFGGRILSQIPDTQSYLLEGSYDKSLADLAIGNSNFEMKIITKPRSWELGVREDTQKDIGYLFANGFFTMSGSELLMKQFPHVGSWQRGQITHIHPDKAHPQNTIMFAGEGGAYKMNSNGELEKFNAFPIADVQNISHYHSDNETLYFIYKNKVMKWSEKEGLSELAQLIPEKHGDPNSIMLLGEKLIVSGTKGVFKINPNGIVTAYLSDPYRVGPIRKIEALPNLHAYLVTGNYGLYVVDENEVASRLNLEGRENEYFAGELVYDGIESYIRTSTGIYRIDAIDNSTH